MTAVEDKLPPCPFCGSGAELIERYNPMSKWRWSVDCAGATCGASGPVEATKADAIAAWNTRHRIEALAVREVPAFTDKQIERGAKAMREVLSHDDGYDDETALTSAIEVMGACVVDDPAIPADEWQDIASAPKDGTAVLAYFGKLTIRNLDGSEANLGPLRAHVEMTAIGFYERGRWLESGTAHDMFEDWRDETQRPTHWRPLPTPPALGDPA